MSKLKITPFDPLNLHSHFDSERPTVFLLQLIRDFPEARCTVVPPCSSDWTELIMWLPHTTDEELQSLAKAVPQPQNYDSADFLRKRSMLCFEATGIEARINLWELNNPFLRNGINPGFGVAFVNQTLGLYAAHLFSPEEIEDYIMGLQGAMISTGPNHNPVRVWGDAFLDEHDGKEDVSESGVVILPCLTWSPNKI